MIPCPGSNYSPVASIVINKSYFQVPNKPAQLDSLVENLLQGRKHPGVYAWTSAIDYGLAHQTSILHISIPFLSWLDGN